MIVDYMYFILYLQWNSQMIVRIDESSTELVIMYVENVVSRSHQLLYNSSDSFTVESCFLILRSWSYNMITSQLIMQLNSRAMPKDLDVGTNDVKRSRNDLSKIHCKNS